MVTSIELTSFTSYLQAVDKELYNKLTEEQWQDVYELIECITLDEAQDCEDDAYERGYEDGEVSGFHAGMSEARYEFESEAENEYQRGYDEGYDEGYASAEKEFSVNEDV